MTCHLITISGQLGSGKSTVAKALSKKLGWEYYSTGMAQRLIAQKRGITTVELNKLAITDINIDKEIDSVFKNPPWGDKNCIVDSRLAFHFLPHSFKVRLLVDPDEAAQRVFQEKRKNEKYTSLEQAKTFLTERTRLEKEHFMKNYQIDITDCKSFDLIIDTTHLSADEVCEKILKAL